MRKLLGRPSTKVCHNGIKFDSQLEYETYCILTKEFDIDDIFAHVPVQIKKKSNHFRAMDLKIDFWVKSINLYIESKGILEYDFSLKLAMLDAINPTILNKFVMVVRDLDDTFRRFGKSHDLLILPINKLQENIKIQRNYYER